MNTDRELLQQRRQQDRRLFLKTNAMLGTALVGGSLASAQEAPRSANPNERLTIGIMGVNGRGGAIAKGMLQTGQVDIAYLCDVDSRAVERVTKQVNDKQSFNAKSTKDFRRILDDKSVDALVCAAPNHWHAPATILGCSAGKHVYVEKPCSYSPEEGELAVAAARKNKRIVQMGTQRRTWPGIVQAIEKVHSGAIGDCLYSRSWYNNRRGPIGHGNVTSPPDWLDWDLWQGPAARRDYKDNVVHYKWHWHWHWGNGELGNNGVHGLDVARWGMQVEFPTAVSVGGGKHRHDDDQETPDTMMVVYDFPGRKTITWEGLSWSALGPHDTGFGASFHGTDGSIVIRNSGYTQYDLRNKEVATGTGAGGDQDHFMNFINSVRGSEKPNAEIEIAHRSTLLCHLGNMAYRVGERLETNPADGRPIKNAAADQLWGREYAKGWEPKV